LAKKRKWNGNGMETERKWNGNGGNEKKRKWLNWITIMPTICIVELISEHWNDSAVPLATTLKFFARTTTLQKMTDTVMPCK